MNLTKDLIISLLVESPSFREFVADQLMVPNNLRDELREQIRSIGRSKIEQIKFIRRTYTGETIQESFPDYTGGMAGGSISLRDAKYFVDWFHEKDL